MLVCLSQQSYQAASNKVTVAPSYFLERCLVEGRAKKGCVHHVAGPAIGLEIRCCWKSAPGHPFPQRLAANCNTEADMPVGPPCFGAGGGDHLMIQDRFGMGKGCLSQSGLPCQARAQLQLPRAGPLPARPPLPSALSPDPGNPQ